MKLMKQPSANEAPKPAPSQTGPAAESELQKFARILDDFFRDVPL